MRHQIVRGFALVVAVGGASFTFAQSTGPRNPPLVIQSVEGRDLFAFYCSTCHGRDGKGNGPVAPALKVPPPDLTLIARRSRGMFSRPRVEAFVTNGGGAPPPAHGSSAMPVWGPVFQGLDPSDTRVKIRIANVVGYIESIQAK